LEKIKNILEEKKQKIENASLIFSPINEISVEKKEDKEQLEKLIENLNDHDDINEVYSNISDYQ